VDKAFEVDVPIELKFSTTGVEFDKFNCEKD